MIQVQPAEAAGRIVIKRREQLRNCSIHVARLLEEQHGELVARRNRLRLNLKTAHIFSDSRICPTLKSEIERQAPVRLGVRGMSCQRQECPGKDKRQEIAGQTA